MRIVIGIIILSTALNLTAKLTNFIDMSWWMVFLPLWCTPIIVIFFLGIFALACIILANSKNNNRK